MCLYHLLKQHVFCFSEVFKLCETENLNFAVYFTIDKHSYEQVHLKVEPKSFLYEFLNSGDPLYHEYIGGCSVHRGFQYKSKAFMKLLLHLNPDVSLMY